MSKELRRKRAKFRLRMNIPAPMEKMPLTLEQRLVRFDPERHSGEVMAVDERMGGEALTCRFDRHDDQSSLSSLIPSAAPFAKGVPMAVASL